MSPTKPRTCEFEALTMHSEARNGIPEGRTACQSPICDVEFEQTGMAMQPRRYCSDQCRMDVFVLRRARRMILRLGIVRFNAFLDHL